MDITNDSLPDESSRRIGRLWRTRHVRTCITCKHVLEGVAFSTDAKFIDGSLRLVEKHAEALPQGGGSIGCIHGRCVHHEEVTLSVARAAVRLTGAQVIPVGRGIRLAHIHLGNRTTGESPALLVASISNPRTAEVFLRMGPRCMAHVVLDFSCMITGIVLPPVFRSAEEVRALVAAQTDPQAIWGHLVRDSGGILKTDRMGEEIQRCFARFFK